MLLMANEAHKQAASRKAISFWGRTESAIFSESRAPENCKTRSVSLYCDITVIGKRHGPA